MKVSVTLHRGEVDLDGNQRTLEARYCGYNRQYADLKIDPATGDGTFGFVDLTFPNVQADNETLTHFSIGVCEGPADKGGAIISFGPLQEPIQATPGHSPQLTAMGGVYAARLAEMLADGRLFTLD